MILYLETNMYCVPCVPFGWTVVSDVRTPLINCEDYISPRNEAAGKYIIVMRSNAPLN